MSILSLFQQATAQSAAGGSSDIPATIQGAVALLVLVGAREVPDLFKHAKTYIDIRSDERKKRVDLLETANAQIKALGERIDVLYTRLDATDDRATKAEQSRNDLAHELETQRETHQEQLTQVKTELTQRTEAAVKEVAAGKDIIIDAHLLTIHTLQEEKEALIQRLTVVTEERDRLLVENTQLKGKNTATDTGEHPAASADAPPIPPEDDPPSSTHLTPGVPG